LCVADVALVSAHCVSARYQSSTLFFMLCLSLLVFVIACVKCCHCLCLSLLVFVVACISDCLCLSLLVISASNLETKPCGAHWPCLNQAQPCLNLLCITVALFLYGVCNCIVIALLGSNSLKLSFVFETRTSEGSIGSAVCSYSGCFARLYCDHVAHSPCKRSSCGG